MLTLSCRTNETIFLLDQDNTEPLITVKCLKIAGNQVRLGFRAPKNIRVLREKLYHRLLNEAAEARKHDQENTGE